MRDNLDGVAVFVEVVEAGGFAKAADRLALTRSAVGKTVARLEARLGVRLFHRTTRTQSLTDDGQIYHEHCLKAISELRAAEQMIESGRHAVVGKLTVSLPVLFGRYCVQPILMELATHYPELQLDLHFSDKVVDVIADGYDLTIRSGSLKNAEGLKARKIAEQRKVICAAPGYLSAHGTPEDIGALSSHNALIYIRHGGPFPWLLHASDGAIVQAEVRGRLQFDNQEAIADAAVRGMGIASLPVWLVQPHIEAGRLVALLEQFPSTTLETYAVWPAAQHIPLRLRVVIDALAAGLQRVSDTAEVTLKPMVENIRIA